MGLMVKYDEEIGILGKPSNTITELTIKISNIYETGTIEQNNMHSDLPEYYDAHFTHQLFSFIENIYGDHLIPW